MMQLWNRPHAWSCGQCDLLAPLYEDLPRLRSCGESSLHIRHYPHSRACGWEFHIPQNGDFFPPLVHSWKPHCMYHPENMRNLRDILHMFCFDGLMRFRHFLGMLRFGGLLHFFRFLCMLYFDGVLHFQDFLHSHRSIGLMCPLDSDRIFSDMS